MGLREDDPVYYKVQMQKLLDKARKNGLKVDYALQDNSRGMHLRVLFRDPGSKECAGATICKKRKG